MILIYLLLAFLIGGGLFLNRKRGMNYLLVILFLVLQVGFTIYACINYTQHSVIYFTFDALGLIMLITATIIAIPAAFHSYVYIEESEENTPRSRATYFGALIFLVTAVSAAYVANHIAVVWIFTEITTLSASALIYHHRNRLALEGTWKYVFICAISITFVFIGILFLSLATGSGDADMLSYTNLMLHKDSLNVSWLQLSFLFIFTGFTAKLGLFPMFTAGVDAKDKAPGPAAALLSSVIMAMGFVGIFRLFAVLSNTSLAHWTSLIVGIAALISIFIATVYMIKVKNIKRMMAYSSVEHMGLVMLGVAAGGVGYYAAVLHIVLHSMVKSSLFFQYNQIYKVYKNKNIYYLGNYFKYNTTGAIVFLLAFLSVTAMPPSGLFVSEFLIFRSLFEAKQILLLIVVLLLLTMIIWAFAKNTFKILFIKPVDFDESTVPVVNPWRSLSQFILIGGAAYLGLNPPAIFVELLNQSVSLLK